MRNHLLTVEMYDHAFSHGAESDQDSFIGPGVGDKERALTPDIANMIPDGGIMGDIAVRR